MESRSHSSAATRRITELDGLRGIAILLVLVWHYLACQFHPAKGSALGYFCQAISLTWSGVDLFFVLSGFLIAGILLENKDAPNYFSVFYLRRICRIFPLYFLMVGVFFAVRAWVGVPAHFSWLFGDAMPFWSYATFTQNVFMVSVSTFGAGWLGITWSLAVEEQFYLVLPVLIWFLPRRMIVPVLVLLVIGAVGLRALRPGFIAYVGMPWRVDSLLMGSLLACGARRRDFMDAIVARKWLLRSVVGVLLLGTIALSASALADWAQRGGVFLHLWLAIFYTALLLLALVDQAGFFGWVLRRRALVWIGTVSFGIYLFHQVVLALGQGAVGNNPPAIHGGRDGAVTVAALLATLLLAAVSFHGMERPILRWGHRFRFQKRAGPNETVNAALAPSKNFS